MIVTIFPETIILPAAAKPETVNVGKSDKIATSFVKVVWFMLESINSNVASPKGEVTATCLKGSQLSGRSGEWKQSLPQWMCSIGNYLARGYIPDSVTV